jgi:membrane protein required for colicin V production
MGDWIDWIILAVLLACVLGGLAQGFFRSVCSLGGLFLGLVLAAWNYQRVGAMFLPIVHSDTVANTIGFLLIALLVMAIANVLGGVLAKAAKWMGLGCLDSLGGAIVGFLQGVLLVMVCILVTIAFFPQTRWLTDAYLPKMFFQACDWSTHVTPSDLTARVEDGLKKLKREAPPWTHPQPKHGSS